MKYEVSSYIKNSEDCREKAALTSRPDHREQWLILAEAWRALAESSEQAFATALRVATVNVGAARREPGSELHLDGQRLSSVAAQLEFVRSSTEELAKAPSSPTSFSDHGRR